MTENRLTSKVLDNEIQGGDLYMLADRVCVNVGEPAEEVTHDRQVGCCDYRGQFDGDMSEHVVVLGPLGARCIDIESSTLDAC